jgi:hypothetical protein
MSSAWPLTISADLFLELGAKTIDDAGFMSGLFLGMEAGGSLLGTLVGRRYYMYRDSMSCRDSVVKASLAVVLLYLVMGTFPVYAPFFFKENNTANVMCLLILRMSIGCGQGFCIISTLAVRDITPDGEQVPLSMWVNLSWVSGVACGPFFTSLVSQDFEWMGYPPTTFQSFSGTCVLFAFLFVLLSILLYFAVPSGAIAAAS